MKRNSLRPALTRVALAVGLAAGALAGVATVSAQSAGKAAPPNIRISDNVVKIGLLHDMNSLYADVAGPGSVEAVKMAVEDFGGKVHGAPIEILVADHQNKADLAAAKAREWFDWTSWATWAPRPPHWPPPKWPGSATSSRC
jgi:branched-chain amino acid transport system substrate-binding protein